MDELIKYLNALPAETREAFAERCGTTVGYLRKAKSANQKLGVTICLGIVRETGGAVTCEQLRPDIDWSFLRGTKPSKKAKSAKAVVV